MKEIFSRFYKYMEYKGLNDNQVTTDCSLSVGLIGQAKRGKSDLGKKAIEKILKKYQDLNRVWLLTGEGEMLNGLTSDNDKDLPVYNIEGSANLVSLYTNNERQEVIGHIKVPCMPKCDFAVFVSGDSMAPLLKSGDIVAVKVVPNEIQSIIPGEMYLLSINALGDEYLTIKFMHPSEKGEEWVKLSSYNPFYEPKDFHLSSIRKMAIVKFSIRKQMMV